MARILQKEREMHVALHRRHAPRQLKLTMVGDKAVGKTALLKTYCQGVFPKGEYISTVFPYISDEDYVYSKPINYAGFPVLLAIWDRVYNRVEDNQIRALQYDKTDVFLLCFNIGDRASFLSAVNVWKPEIQRHCPKTPFILLGLQKDTRNGKLSSDSQREVITRSMGNDMAERLGAIIYLECSAKRKEGVKEAFAVAVQTAMNSPPPKHRKKNSACGSRFLRFMKLL